MSSVSFVKIRENRIVQEAIPILNDDVGKDSCTKYSWKSAHGKVHISERDCKFSDRKVGDSFSNTG